MQLRIFALCLACGVLSGIVYDFLYLIRRAASGKTSYRRNLRGFAATAVCDVLYAVALSAMFVALSTFFSFPDVRAYMLAAVILGAALYIKSFHIMVAFLVNRVYNKYTKSVKCKKSAPRRAVKGAAADFKR